MARKFNEIRVDGAERRNVVVKIDNDTGVFEATIDGVKVVSESYKGICEEAKKLAFRLDALTLKPFYCLSRSLFNPPIQAFMLSMQQVDRWYSFRGEKDKVRVAYPIEMDKELRPLVEGVAEGRPIQVDPDTRYLPCTEENRKALLQVEKDRLELRGRQEALAKEEKKIEQRLSRLVERRGLAGDELQEVFGGEMEATS